MLLKKYWCLHTKTLVLRGTIEGVEHELVFVNYGTDAESSFSVSKLIKGTMRTIDTGIGDIRPQWNRWLDQMIERH